MTESTGKPVSIPFLSHHEELFDGLTGKSGSYEDTCRKVEESIDAGKPVVLEHSVNRANVTLLPDFVRFVDDRFPGVTGIRFSLADGPLPLDREGYAPWWAAALWACRDRQVGFALAKDCTLPEVVPAALADSDIAARTRQAGPASTAAVTAEVVLLKKGPQDPSYFAAATAALDQAGGIDSLVRPSRGHVPREVLWCPGKGGDWSPEQMATLLGSMRSVGCCRVVLTAGKSGPDVMEREDLPKIVQLACSNGLQVSVSAGLRGPEASLCSRLVQSGTDEFRIRLDRPDTNAVQRLKLWSDLSGDLGFGLVVETVLPAGSISQSSLDQLHDAVCKAPISSWNVSGPLALPAGPLSDNSKTQRPDLELLGRWLLDRVPDSPIPIQPICLPVYQRTAVQAAEEIVAAGGKPPVTPRDRGCPAAVAAAYIDETARMAPCPHLLPFGESLEEHDFDFARAWEQGQSFLTLRNSADITGRCGFCEYRGPCFGCRAASILEGGGLTGEDPWCTHDPQRPARENPLVLLKISDSTAGVPDPALVMAVAQQCRQAGTTPHVAVGLSAQPDAAGRTELEEACLVGKIPYFAITDDSVEVRKGTSSGRSAARQVSGLVDYDQILAIGRFSSSPFEGAFGLPFALLPAMAGEPLEERMLQQLAGRKRPMDSRATERLVEEVLTSQGISLLLAKDHGGQPLDLAQTVPTGLFLLQLPEEGMLLAGTSPTAMDRIAQQVTGLPPEATPHLQELLSQGFGPSDPATLRVTGVPAESSRAPVACLPPQMVGETQAIAVDTKKCTGHGTCALVCPVDCIQLGTDNGRQLPVIRQDQCIRCNKCIEFCPERALSPVSSPEDAGEPVSLGVKDPGWLAGLSHSAPADTLPSPPSWQQPRKFGKRLIVLGLSMTTQQHHGAALVIDGEIVGAVEEERFRRRKPFGWFPTERPGATVVADPSIPVEYAFPRQSINWLLKKAGISLEDVDCFAINGIHGRFKRTYSLDDQARPPQVLKSGRFMYIPHHLAHAASAVRVAGYENGFAFTVDGRGERETAAFFEVEDGVIRRKFDLLVGEDSLIGGVYETVTRILGFGTFGQGSTMGLAALPHQGAFDFSRFMSARSHDNHSIRQRGIAEEFGHLSRGRDEALTDQHIALAAAVQQALEDTVLRLIEEGLAGRKADNLCLAGGVVLNCRMNLAIRQHFQPGNMFLQPAAHDAGTALGAALEAHFQTTGSSPDPTTKHAYLGPDYTPQEIRNALEKADLPYEHRKDIARETAERVADGQIVCWFQGPLEFGPRALGSRSVLADPRSRTVKERANVLKGRQWWRPFGPSILEGREADYFEPGFSSPFMLFTVPVRKDKWDEIPAVLHLDQTTRPQSVRKDENPRYHEMISEFEKLTGVPMVLNTSFNTAFEPIVNSPEDAIASFLHLGADYLAIGDYLVERRALNRRTMPAPAPAKATASAVASDPVKPLPKGQVAKRLMLRLTTRCNSACQHCTVADISDQQERSPEAALQQIAQARQKGSTELVFMRGEATLRKDLPALAKRARTMGYTLVQVQTNGRILSYEKAVRKFLKSGVNFFEVSLYADNAGLHDRIAGSQGAFDQTVTGLGNLVRSGAKLMVSVPVLKRNYLRLPKVVTLLHKLGVKRVQFNFARPVKIGPEWNTAPLVRLSEASPWIRLALEQAATAGLEAGTEGVPICHLGSFAAQAGDGRQAVAGFSAVDLHRSTDSVSDQFRQARPLAPECASCPENQTCPTTWAAYQHLFGTWEFAPLGGE